MSLSTNIRYKEDPVFANLVDILYNAICEYDYTPTELREAAHMAAIKYETLHIKPIIILRADLNKFIDLNKLKDA